MNAKKSKKPKRSKKPLSTEKQVEAIQNILKGEESTEQNSDLIDRREFKKLQLEWYNRARESGFTDSEVYLEHQVLLPEQGQKKEHMPIHIPIFNLYDEVFSSKGVFYTENFDYFANCRAFLHTFPFKYQYLYDIWHLFCEGHTIRSIQAIISKRYPRTIKYINPQTKKTTYRKFSVGYIHTVLADYKKIMSDMIRNGELDV